MSPPLLSRLLIPVAVIAINASTVAASSGVSPAAAIAVQLSPSLTGLTDFTSLSDPEHLLGLPGQYIAKAQFEDANQVTGIVEVFAYPDDFNARLSTLEFAVTSQEVDVSAPNSKVIVRLFSQDADARGRALNFYSSVMASIGLT